MTADAKRAGAEGQTRIDVTAHPPERLRPAGSVVLPCGCCCCCCCLHTLGGVIGAIAGSIKPIDPRPRPVDSDFPFPFRRDEFEGDGQVLSAGVLYWLLVCFGAGLVTVWPYVSTGARRSDSLSDGLFLTVMVLPAVQLAASAVAMAIVFLFYTDRRTAALRIGKITLWSFVGTIVGIGIMGGFCGFFGLLR
jgi:hypothetical protein